MKQEKICGIYCIENTINNKKYIGSSINIYDRWRHHISSLNRNKHHSVHLNASWNKYGKNSFSFSIIETCAKDNLIDREQFYINKFKVANKNNGYNVQQIAGRTNYDGVTIEKLKENKKSICFKQYLDIKYYLTTSDIPILEISRITNVKADTIYKIYYGKQFKKIFNTSDFISRHVIYGENHYSSYLTENKVKEIISYFINGYTNLEISEILKVSPKTLSDIRNHRSWNYLTDGLVFPNPKIIVPSRRKKVNAYDKNKHLKHSFNSISDAVEFLHINGTGNIMSCLKGKRNSAYGYHWEYA